ncbi:MAG: DUF1549 domain-containing protein, partial [Chthonomonadaceae bacterium]|nr:DUF1549 domain-containing protein [Chthonomonadaceae bacterium]
MPSFTCRASGLWKLRKTLLLALVAMPIGGLWNGLPAQARKDSRPPATPGNPALSAQDREFFETRVRPLLVEQCFQCHSATQNVAMGRLQMDSRTKLLRGGGRGPAIVPGKPEESLLIRAIQHTDPQLQMPPNGKLTAEQIATLTEWIRRGAFWPDRVKLRAEGSGFDLKARARHWAYQPLRKVSPPPVRNRSWVRTPIDAFILARLEAKGLRPAPEADRRTLIRRAYYDLLGLPPTPE